jgi:hypothetical protein
MQGFSCGVESGGLRFTPAVSAVFLLTATVLRSPALFLIFAAVSAVGAAGFHAVDFAYDHLVRPLFAGARLPPNPPPRRFSMFLAAMLSALAGVAFANGWHLAGTALGLSLALGGLLASSVHFCTGAWIYHLVGLGGASRAAGRESGHQAGDAHRPG